MLSISKQSWKTLLVQLDKLVSSRLRELSENATEPEKAISLKTISDFKTDFISKGLGVKLTAAEELICFIAMLPYLVPGYFDKIISGLYPNGADLPELGGVKGINHRGFIPTGETILFLLAGTDVHERLQVMHLFNPDQPLAMHHILKIESIQEGEPLWSGKLIINAEILEKLRSGGLSHPPISAEFPAKPITTHLDWNNLVINKTTMAEVETIQNWLAHHQNMVKAWGLQHMFIAGYKALFYGPPGTGKTFTATLLGKQFKKEVYRIDLSQVVSKYIGETEKNLEKVFQKAENKNWILFFDEADALFGKRTSISSAHDRYANQETAYLLQRIEDFDGLVILASNDKSNIDPAFVRRFNAIVHFPVPDPEERLHLWNIYLPQKNNLSREEVNEISARYEVTGSTVLNAIHHSAINAFASKRLISYHDVIESLKREMRKEDRMLS